jgi:outer membrane receptor protein involved in Fe transport
MRTRRTRSHRFRRLAASVAAAGAIASRPELGIAGTTGKISGLVVDSQQKPVVAATVALVGQPYGAFTGADGRFNVLNVPPGTYDVRISRVGLEPYLVTGITVSADHTTPLNAVMQVTGITTQTVVVRATRPPVDIHLTSSMQSVQSRDIAQLPVQDLQDVVDLQAGVVAGHFRGGRLGEVQYQVDGVSINNAYDNTASLVVDRSLLQEVQVISGTFDAEYGQAMSGVVNAVLKDGTPDFRWQAELYGGAFLFPARTDDRLVSDGFYPNSSRNVTFTASGPTGLRSTNFLANIRYYGFDDYVTGERRYQPAPTPIRNDAGEQIGTEPTPGDGASVVLGYQDEWSGAGKITTRAISNVELGYQALFNIHEGRASAYRFRFNPDGMSKQQSWSLMHGLDVSATLGKASFLETSLRRMLFSYDDRAYEDLYDPRYEVGPPVEIPSQPGIVAWGVDFTRFAQDTRAWNLKSSYTSQLTSVQQIKTGIEVLLPEVSFGNSGTLTYTTLNGQQTLIRHVDEPPDYPGIRTYWPVSGAAFAQDHLEWDDFNLRAGLRFDYFDARATLPSDPANPANAISGVPQSVPERTSRKATVSPRLGVAYPITTNAGVHFAYGHFYQYPPIGDMFANADYTVLAQLQAGTSDFSRVMGNPDVDAEKTVQYEFGYKQAFSPAIGFDATIFFKDIRDLHGVEFINTYNDATYARLTNVDFGNVLGFTLAFDHNELGPARLALDYTFQRAHGNTSDPYETATRAQNGDDPRPTVSAFNWDQTHTINGTLSMENPGVWSASAILRLASGQPYTPILDAGFGNGLERNSARKPNGVLVDLRGERAFRIGRQRVSLFGRVFNLFDSRFFNGFVFTTTGSPYYSRFPVTDQVQLEDPTRFWAPRRVELGLILGAGSL